MPSIFQQILKQIPHRRSRSIVERHRRDNWVQRIYGETLREMGEPDGPRPMSEAEFRSTLDPVAIVRSRATAGGPQPSEMKRMIDGSDRTLGAQQQWIAEHRRKIDTAIANLDADFQKILTKRNWDDAVPLASGQCKQPTLLARDDAVDGIDCWVDPRAGCSDSDATPLLPRGRLWLAAA